MTIDINCDLGEGLNNEKLLMQFISSCNIACGGHAGSEKIIERVIGLAIKHNVKIGAHPGFPDQENFGRVVMDISDDELQKSLIDQMELFKKCASRLECEIHHVKPHGALYNLIAVNKDKAEVVIAAIKKVFNSINMYVPFNSVIESVAIENGLPIIYEAFADRNYNDDLTLVPRVYPYAVLSDKEKILNHVKRMSEESKVKTVQGNIKEIKAETFCVHGDNKKAIEILEFLHQNLSIA